MLGTFCVRFDVFVCKLLTASIALQVQNTMLTTPSVWFADGNKEQHDH